MQANDLNLLLEAAQAAGEIAKSYFQNDPKVWEKEDDAGPVTEADLAVNTLLEDTLRKARPDYGWLSEESADDLLRLDAERVFIIDPIDGTRSFIQGSRTWAHSLAIAERGRIIAAAILLPMRDMMFSAEKNGGARLNGQTISATQRARIDGAQILATKPNLDPKHWRGNPAPAFDRHHRPSLAYRLALTSQGAYDAMMTLRPSWEWDIAAGALIAAEAGAAVSDKTGAALRFNNADPLLNGVLVAGPALHSQLLGRLTRSGEQIP